MMESSAIEGYRLSPQQQRLWALHQADPTQPQRVYGSFLLAGALQLSALETALQQLMQRHEILHTTFQCLPGMTVPLQVIETDCDDVELLVLPSSAPSPDQALAALLNMLEHDTTAKTTPLSQAVLRGTIAPLSPQQHLLLLTLPALCADASTWQRLGWDLSQLYAVAVGASSVEDALGTDDPMQYVDVAEWQNDLLAEDAAGTGQAFWQTIRERAMPVTLPFERRGARDQGQMQRLELTLSPNCCSSMAALAEPQDACLSMVLLTTWAIVLGRLANVTDLTLGLMVDGRHYDELEQAVGTLSRVLPLSLSLDKDVSFSQAMQQTQQSVQEARQWQDYVWPESIADLPPALGFEFATWRPATAAGLTISLYQHETNPEPFQLTLSCTRHHIQPGEDVLTAELQYDAQRFSAAAVAQIAHYVETGLAAALAAPKTPIQRLNLWTEDTRQRFLTRIQQSGTEGDDSAAPQDSLQGHRCATIHQWFEVQVKRSPTQTAAVFEEEQLTYDQLNTQANQLAHYLRQIGIEAEDRIVLYGDRGLQMLIGIWGVLKAGAAYVPIDPSVPIARIPGRLQEVQAAAVLTQQDFGMALPPLPLPVVQLDGAEQAAIAQQSVDNPIHSIQPENLAYVLFTSGSTGQPKGVAVEHRQIVNYVHGILPKLDLREGHHCALVSTLAADLGNTMLFPCLCVGGCLHLMAPERILDPTAWAEYAQQHPIDSLKIVPSHLKSLLGAPDAAAILPRHTLVLGGETIHWDLIEQVRQLSPCRVLNHYGPTETTVGVLTHPVESASAPDVATVPLGRPLLNVRVYLLDGQLQPVPAGIPGELYIAGASVTRGYVNRPQRTAIAFLPDPFSLEPGTQMYKTGDRGRYRLDGTIEFLGRQDHQVKLRGFRIELGEIETALQRHPAVQDAAALVQRTSDHPQLVAYVIPQDYPGPEAVELRQFLHGQLPDPMVPAALIPLRQFPLGANSKLDRQALQAMAPLPLNRRTEYVVPRSELETAIAQLWTQVLGLEQVGIHDNFFELGGDSILCIQIIAKAHQVGLQFTPKQLFERPTVAQLATVVNTVPMIEAEQGLITGAVPLTPIQHWFFEQPMAERYHWNQSLLLKSQAPLNVSHLDQALRYLIHHHDALRLRFRDEAGKWQQWSAAEAGNMLTEVDLSTLAGTAQTQHVERAVAVAQTSLDLENKLFHAVLFRLGEKQGDRLLFVVHHLVIDGVSWRILLTDLQQSYQQLHQERPIVLPPKTTAFKTWSHRLQIYAQTADLQVELAFWLAQGQLNPPLLVDDPNGENSVALSHTLTVSLSASETQALLQEVHSAYQTQINDLLLTALVLAMSPWTGMNGLCVDLEGHGREDLFPDVDLSRTVGWFTTIFPIRIQSIETPKTAVDFGNTIKSIKEQLRQIPHQGIGYGVLRWLGAADVAAQLSSIPPSQVRWNYLGQIDQVMPQTALLTPASESWGPGRSPQSQRPYVLDISAMVSNGQLDVTWDYSTACYQHETIKRLADGYLSALRSLIHHCQSAEAGGFTPSDFPDAHLDQAELDQLLAQIQ